MRAEVKNWKWSSTNPSLLKLLETFKPIFGIPGWVHEPDNWLADQVVEKIGGIVTDRDPKFVPDPDKIY